MLLESLVSSVRRVLCCQGNPDYDDDGLGDDDDDHHDHHDHCAIFTYILSCCPSYVLLRDPLDQYSDWPCNKCDFSLEVPDLFTSFCFFHV